MHKAALAAFVMLGLPVASAQAGELRLSIANGRVTIVAQDVTIRQILDEWGRVGQTRIVGAERLAGPTVTLELRDVPEARALESLLRTASGYIAKPRAGTVGASTFDRILIMPTSRAPAVSAAAPSFSNPRPQPQVIMPNVIVDDEPEPNGIIPPGALPQPQQFIGQPPQPGMVPGMQPGQPTPTLTRPGQLPPPSPNVPGNPDQGEPINPVRPPGVPRPGGGGGQL